MLKKLIAAAATIASAAMPAGATPQSPDYSNGGQCAGNALSKCRYSLEIIEPNEPMVVVPNLEMVGPSRISTVEFCAEMVGVNDWSDMITDLELDGMYVCLIEHT